MTYLKTLTADGCGPWSGKRGPQLPTQNPDGTWTPGAWTEPVKTLSLCKSGWHVTDAEHVHEYLAATAYVTEIDGENKTDGSKTVATCCRLVHPVEGWTAEVIQRLAFACADRAVRIHAPAALDKAGRHTEAKRLRDLPPIVDRESAAAAAHAAAAAAATAAATDAAAYAAAYAAAAATDAAAYAAAYAAAAAADAAAAGAAAYAAAAAAGERQWQHDRLRELIPALKELGQ